jgi:hypothetical protein
MRQVGVPRRVVENRRTGCSQEEGNNNLHEVHPAAGWAPTDEELRSWPFAWPLAQSRSTPAFRSSSHFISRQPEVVRLNYRLT